MKRKIVEVLVGILIGTVVSLSIGQASTIDTTGSQAGGIAAFGSPNTATYGQTFTAPDPKLLTFSLYLENRWGGDTGSGTLDLRGYIGGWNGTQVTSILFESATQTMNAAGTLQQFTFSPSLTLTVGNEYIAFLSISNLPVQPQNLFLMPYTGIDNLASGGFVYINNGNDPSEWTGTSWALQGPNDVWFQASFANTPLPGALPLFATGLGALSLLGWRRKRKFNNAGALPTI